MTIPSGQPEGMSHRRAWRWGALLAVLTLGFFASVVVVLFTVYFGRLGPAQPISFSHRVHFEKQLSCLFCHPGVIDSPRAGIPPLETCLLCHRRIIPTHPQILSLRRHYAEQRPVEWVRVNALPDFVYFTHEVHTRAGFDCGRCHGAVGEMDRIAQVVEFQMGFCVQCHRDQNFSHDCLICHR